jgi:hypothetical protein
MASLGPNPTRRRSALLADTSDCYQSLVVFTAFCFADRRFPVIYGVLMSGSMLLSPILSVLNFLLSRIYSAFCKQCCYITSKHPAPLLLFCSADEKTDFFNALICNSHFSCHLIFLPLHLKHNRSHVQIPEIG